MESTTSSTSSMKGGNSNYNGSDLNKNNILKPTFDPLTEEGGKAFEAYRANFEELFLWRGEVARYETVLKDTTPVIFHKSEVIPEVRPESLPSRNNIQSMINYVLERQAKSIDELLRTLIEEQDGKKLDATSVNSSSSTCMISFTKTNPHTSGASTGGTTIPTNHIHSQATIEGSTPIFGMSQQTMVSIFG
jgi:hypothetical protein